MKKLLIIIGFFTLIRGNAQTIEGIDSLRERILTNLDQYKRVEFSNKTILNEDALRYDSARFYLNEEGDLIYVNWLTRGTLFSYNGRCDKLLRAGFNG